jgi:hypothetical protein
VPARDEKEYRHEKIQVGISVHGKQGCEMERRDLLEEQKERRDKDDLQDNSRGAPKSSTNPGILREQRPNSSKASRPAHMAS